MSHVFISYAHGDADFATVVKARLEEAHLGVWVDTRAIAAGSDWSEEIDRGRRRDRCRADHVAGGESLRVRRV